MSVRSCKYRLRPSRAQSVVLDLMLRDFCGRFNAGLQQRIEAYRRRSARLRYGQQAGELKACRAADPDGLGRWSFSALQQVLRRLDQTYAAFFTRRRGFLRFRASARFHSATLRVGDGLTIRKDRRIGIVGLPGGLKAVWHRDLPRTPRSAPRSRPGSRASGTWCPASRRSSRKPAVPARSASILA